MEEYPTWLKVMQNGTIGEARAKAFLLDRFWILERSVDIDGADFIIQRRITKNNILDRNPPRFGIVQVKFFGSAKTTHYIPEKYVLDDKKEARDEFFLLCFSGGEDDSKIFFLTAKMIKENFVLSEIKDANKFRIYGKNILLDNKFLIQNKKNTLDRIENQLIHADFVKNRQFLSWRLPSTQIDTSAILPDFKEPLNNWWGDIPKEFKKVKDSAYSALIKVEEIFHKLKSITEETNPLKAFEFAQDIEYECNRNMQLQLPDDLYDEEFERVCHNHLEQLNKLRNDGLLDSFLEIRQNIAKQIITYLTDNLPFDPNIVHSIFIEFNSSDFSIVNISQELTRVSDYWNVSEELNQFGHMEIPTSSYDGIKDISDTKFEFYWLPGRIYIEEKFKKDLKGFYEQTDFRLYYTCMEKMYYSKY